LDKGVTVADLTRLNQAVRGLLTNHPTTTISEVLRHLHDHTPPMSQRAIGAQVDLHHDTVGKIREAAAEVLGVEGGGTTPWEK
jgi:hypothetical protein